MGTSLLTRRCNSQHFSATGSEVSRNYRIVGSRSTDTEVAKPDSSVISVKDLLQDSVARVLLCMRKLSLRLAATIWTRATS